MQTTLPHDVVGNILADKRVILASASPRRKEILEECLGWSGFEVIPSTFDETLSHREFEGRESEYPVETAAHKAIEVYEREVVRRQHRDGTSKEADCAKQANPANPPDLIISADTIVLLASESPAHADIILEKPGTKAKNLSMLEEQNNRVVKCITGVNIVYPTTTAPGYAVRSMSATTTMTFADCPASLLTSYVESGEGLDRAGGFAAQGLGSILIKSISGDYHNAKGFPAHAFYAWLRGLIEEEVFPADD